MGGFNMFDSEEDFSAATVKFLCSLSCSFSCSATDVVMTTNAALTVDFSRFREEVPLRKSFGRNDCDCTILFFILIFLACSE